MGILIIDDSKVIRNFFAHMLDKEGYKQIHTASSAAEAYQILDIDEDKRQKNKKNAGIDLILLDILLEESDGIEICKKIKQTPYLEDVPVIMVTARSEMDWLDRAFKAGAMDYILKSASEIEFLARVSSALKLREEMKKRKRKEVQLRELNKKLEKMVSIDGLTGLSNRRFFDKTLRQLWDRCYRLGEDISLIMIDIDNFKLFNDTYGHLAGDECLREVAEKIENVVHKPDDLIARYGGEEFAVVLPGTDLAGALTVAERIRSGVLDLEIENKKSDVSDYLTVSLGCVTTQPLVRAEEEKIKGFIDSADKFLYAAKEAGRNTIKYSKQE